MLDRPAQLLRHRGLIKLEGQHDGVEKSDELRRRSGAFDVTFVRKMGEHLEGTSKTRSIGFCECFFDIVDVHDDVFASWIREASIPAMTGR